MKKVFHPRVAMVVSIVLGGILLYTCYHKITDPPDFAKIIYNYKLFPPQTINLLAIYMPWVEAIAGLALVTGFGRRGASFLAMLLFTSFIVILSYNLARDCPTVCGCFDTYASSKGLSDAEKFAKMRWEVFAVDVPCLLLASHAFVASLLNRK